jgi:hypothetical protein
MAYGKTGFGQQKYQLGQRILLADMFMIRPLVKVMEKTIRKYPFLLAVVGHVQKKIPAAAQLPMKVPHDLLVVANVFQHIDAINEVEFFNASKLEQVSLDHGQVGGSAQGQWRQGKVQRLNFGPGAGYGHFQCVRTIAATGIEDAAKLPQWQSLALAAEMQAADVLADMRRTKASFLDERERSGLELFFNPHEYQSGWNISTPAVEFPC